jgi:dihydrodipicolinate reductase
MGDFFKPCPSRAKAGFKKSPREIKQTDGVVLDVKLDKGDDLNAVLDQFEVLIDFTRPEATLDYLATCLSANKTPLSILIR